MAGVSNTNQYRARAYRGQKGHKMNEQQIRARAQEIAGCIWEGCIHGTLAHQLRECAEWRNLGTDGDLTDADRAELYELAEEAGKLPIETSQPYDNDSDNLF